LLLGGFFLWPRIENSVSNTFVGVTADRTAPESLVRVVHRVPPGVLAGLIGGLCRFLYGLGICLVRGTPGYGWRGCHGRGDIVRGEGDEPVLVGALSPIFPPLVVVIEALCFFDEAKRLEDRHVTDDGTAMEAALIRNRLVGGEALVGFAISEGEEDGVGCPDRAGESRYILVGDFLKADPVIFFVRAGFGFGGVTVASGCAHGILSFHHPSSVLHST
jgi:hypothetical protein